jgi:hypothetical protein
MLRTLVSKSLAVAVNVRVSVCNLFLFDCLSAVGRAMCWIVYQYGMALEFALSFGATVSVA